VDEFLWYYNNVLEMCDVLVLAYSKWWGNVQVKIRLILQKFEPVLEFKGTEQPFLLLQRRGRSIVTPIGEIDLPL